MNSAVRFGIAGAGLSLITSVDEGSFYPDTIQKAYEKLSASFRILSTTPTSSSGEKY